MKRTYLAMLMAGTVCGSALAQVGEEGRISTQSNVTMSVEGSSGTAGTRLDALAKVLGKPLGDVKQCYGELVKNRPEVVGTLIVELEVPEKGNPKVRTPNASKALKQMDKCLDKAFAKLDVSQVPRPAGARITLELTNSAAKSVEEVKDRGEAANKVDVKQTPDGGFESTGTSLQGEVLYKVRSKGKNPDGSEMVERIHQGVRDALPSLFDCRRKASKKSSPAGELVLAVNLKGKAAPDIEVSSCTVPAERAPFCVDQALTQFLPREGWGRAEVTIQFAP
jgi:hypothetical protein